jgi:tetratricopeptide (TPR) repeat protein
MIASNAKDKRVSRGTATMRKVAQRTASTILAGLMTVAGGLAMGQGPAPSPLSSPFSGAIERETQAIHAAERKALPDEKLGAMWGVLGSYYQDAAEYEQAERAYTQALHLLRTPGEGISPALANYAIVLDDLGSVYLETGRLEEAENTRRNALSVRRELGDARAVAVSQGHLAEVELARHRFEDAARDARAASDSLAGTHDIDGDIDPKGIDLHADARDKDASDRVAALVTLSYALGSEQRCAEGLKAAEQAWTLAQAAFPPDAVPQGHVLMALGLAQWRTRANAEAEQSMRDGLHILKQHTAPGSAELVSALMEYRGFLKSQKRRNEIAALDAEMEQMRQGTPSGCANCSVSVYALVHPPK